MSSFSLAQRQRNSSPTSQGREAREIAPPLVAWVWVVAFAAVAVTAFLLAAVHVDIPQSEAFVEFNQRRLDDFAATRDSDELRVVMLGNSRLKYGTVDERLLAGLAADRGYRRMRFLRLVNNWAVFEDFASLQDAIFAARPHLVAIQLELLAQERAEHARALLLREYVEWLVFGRGPWNPGKVDQAELQYGTPCATAHAPESLEDRKRRVRRWLQVRPDGPSSRLARAFIARAAAQGTAVVLLAVPRTSRMEVAMRPATSHMVAIADRLASVHPELRRLESKGFPDQLYCDLVHMAEPARYEFSAWLVGAMSRLSRARGVVR